jgi:flagellar biosynthesis protein FlhF
MHLKRYEGRSLKETLEKVKKELGPNALILSSRYFRKDHGLLGLVGGKWVEVMAAREASSEKERKPGNVGCLKDIRRFTPLSRDSVGGGTAAREAKEPSSAMEPGGAASATGSRTDRRVDSVEEDLFREAQNHPMFDNSCYSMNKVPGVDPLYLDELGFDRELRSAFHKLLNSGVHPRTVLRLVRRAQLSTEKELGVGRRLAASLSQLVPCVDLRKVPPRVVALVGPTGVGKTTTIAKLAARDRFAEGRRVALVTVDNFRIAALEQIKVYADILGIPLKTAEQVRDLPRVVKGLEGFDRVYVDTAGKGPGDGGYVDELKEAFDECRGIHCMLLISAATNEKDARHAMQWFSRLSPASLTITKTDECGHFGPMLSGICDGGPAPAYITNGQRVPDDVELATPQTLLKVLLGKPGWVKD